MTATVDSARLALLLSDLRLPPIQLWREVKPLGSIYMRQSQQRLEAFFAEATRQLTAVGD